MSLCLWKPSKSCRRLQINGNDLTLSQRKKGMNKTIVTTESVSKLLKYATPKVQRHLNHEHIDEMVEDQKIEYDTWKCFSMVQSITVAYVRHESLHYVLDGHHRLQAFTKLSQLGYPVHDLAIPVVLYTVDSVDEMVAYYNRINKNMPIHPVEKMDTYADYEKQIICMIVETFPLYIKDRVGVARCPHINIHELKRHIHARQIGDKLRTMGCSIEVFWNGVLSLNEYVEKTLKDKQLDATMTKRIQECESKFQSGSTTPKGSVCYLGIWRKYQWIDICMQHVMCSENDKKFNMMTYLENSSGNKRKRVPAIVRQHVWKKTNDNVGDTGKCYVCENDLLFANMECGHIHAHALGGSDTVDNMMPVCKTCNRDMGIMHLMDYKRMIESMMLHA
jgi:HNH endonuclease